MWIGLGRIFDVFDPVTGKIINNDLTLLPAMGFAGNLVTDIKKESKEISIF